MSFNKRNPFDEQNLLLTAAPTLVNGLLTLPGSNYDAIPARVISRVHDLEAAAVGTGGSTAITFGVGIGTLGAVTVLSFQNLKQGVHGSQPRTAKCYQPVTGTPLTNVDVAIYFEQSLLDLLNGVASVIRVGNVVTVTHDSIGDDFLMEFFTDDTTIAISQVVTAAVEPVGAIADLTHPIDGTEEAFQAIPAADNPLSAEAIYINANGPLDRVKVELMTQLDDGSVRKKVLSVFATNANALLLQNLFDVASETDQTVVTD
jgi:hypothetical protein